MRCAIVLLTACAAIAQTPQSPPGDIVARAEAAPLDPTRKATLVKALEARDYRIAEKLLVSEIDRQPKSPELLSLAGGIFFIDNQPWNAAIAFKKAEKFAPLDARDRFTLAMAYVAVGRGEWARPELERLSREDPRNPEYVYWLGRIDYDAGKYPDAAAHFEAVLRMDPDRVNAYDNLALSLEGLGKLDDAKKSYEEAVRRNRLLPHPSEWPPLNFGTLLIRLGRVDEGARMLQESLRYNSRSAEAHYRLGLALEQEKQDPGALVELRRAVDLDPKYSQAYYAMGRIYRRLGNEAEARGSFEKFQQTKKEKR